jgi:hypothetical protein
VKYYVLINSIWNKEKVPEQWNESIIVPVHKKGDKIDCSNYRGISLLSTSYKILSNILLSRLSPYTDEIIGVCSSRIIEYVLCLWMICSARNIGNGGGEEI